MSTFGFRLTALLLTVSLDAVPLKVHAEESADEYTGSFGDHITWTLEEDTLTLSGSGDVLLFEEAPWIRYKDQIRTLKVDEGITALGYSSILHSTVTESMFSGYRSLEKIILGDSVKYLGNSCFRNCDKLEFVSLSFDLLEIGELCFEHDNSLRSIQFPDHLTTLGEGCFANCSSIQFIVMPESVTVLPRFCFQNCTGLQCVMLSGLVSEIGEYCFSGCLRLEDFGMPDSVQYIGRNAFQGTQYLLNQGDFVMYHDGILYIYQGRAKILTIPETVKTINPDAVKSDTIMEVICPPSVTEIQTGGIQGKYLTIVGTSGTAAEAYAAQNGIPFRDMNAEPPQGTDMTLDFEKDIWSFGNSGKVFGGDYYLSDTDRERLTELGISTSSNQSWGGSCVGLSVTVILAKNGIFAPVQLQSGADSLAEIEPTEDVVSFINYFQRIQGRSDASSAYEHDDLMFCRMVNTAKNVQYGESPFLLTFATKNGSHAVVGYGQESGKWTYDGKTYDARILVWDSNSPNALRDSSCLYYDSETFDYCIPQYGVHVAEGADGNTAGIITVCNDLGVLNAYPYPFELHYQTGDINCDGKVSVADAVLLSRFLTAQTELSDSQMILADVSGDKKLNAADLTVLKRQLLYQSNVKA